MPNEIHKWPAEGQHLFGPWNPVNRNEEYRQCVHPDCHHYETRKTAKA